MDQASNYTLSSSDEYLSFGSIEMLFDETGFGSLVRTNTMCCGVVAVYKIIQYLIFGSMRVSEQQILREAFWDFFSQKVVFLLFILDAKTNEERSAWAVWFTVIGSILLLSSICKDRFEYLASSPAAKRWSLVKVYILMSLLLIITASCTAAIFVNYNFSTQTLFLLADATYALTYVISVITRFLILTYDMRTNSVWENRASIIYYCDLIFAMLMFSIELLNRSHILIISNASLIIKFACLMKIHTVVMEIHRRYRRHRNYLLVQLMESNFPMATKEDVDRNSDDCAICWDAMESARKLPCGHLFHNSCLRSWLEQDTSCPTCRTSLKGQQDDLLDDIETQSESDEEFIETARTHTRNHFFHFDSSNYTSHPLLSWLPTISVEGFM